MTSSGEQAGPAEREAELAALRKAMGKAARRKDMGRYGELKAEHDAAKVAHVEASHAEMKAEMRAQRAVRRPVAPVDGRVAEDARWRRVIRLRYGAGMTAVIWRPGR